MNAVHLVLIRVVYNDRERLAEYLEEHPSRHIGTRMKARNEACGPAIEMDRLLRDIRTPLAVHVEEVDLVRMRRPLGAERRSDGEHDEILAWVERQIEVRAEGRLDRVRFGSRGIRCR